LNVNQDKTIELSQRVIPDYIPWKSILLDITSDKWEKYRAWTIFVKNYIKRKVWKNKDIDNEWLFYLDEKELLSIYTNNDYCVYIFYIDYFFQTFNVWKMKLFLNSFKDSQSVIDFFQFDIDMINTFLQKQSIWTVLSLDDDNYLDFRENLSKLDVSNMNKSYVIDFILRKLMLLQMKPYSLWLDDNGQTLWNKKEILKISKTEDKLNSTFTNEMFDLAINERVLINTDENDL
jgi:hypothetical protein